MKSRPKPVPAKGTNRFARLGADPQIEAWRRSLGRSRNANASATERPEELSEEKLLFLIREIEHADGLKARYDTELLRALHQTTPAVAHPERTDVYEDFGHMWAQPEMQRFWVEWQPPVVGQRGPRASIAAVKATMAHLAMARKTSHIATAHADLRADLRMQDLFARVDFHSAESARAAGRDVPPLRQFSVPQFAAVMKHTDKLGVSCRPVAVRATVAMLKELRRLNPNGDVGKRWLIDGTAVPAWAPQVGGGGKGTPRDMSLRRYSPEAGFRYYGYTNAGKVSLEPGMVRPNGTRVGRGRAWRGYSSVSLIEQSTGIALPPLLADAAESEADLLVPLLAELHREWPDVEAEVIVGDGAWHKHWACRVAEVEYGITPVFRFIEDPTQRTSRRLTDLDSRSGSIAAIRTDGRLECPHGKPLDYQAIDRPNREGLKPGDPGAAGRENLFRIRTGGGCDRCGRTGLRMSTDWRLLTTLPHHPHGRLDRYAMRQVLLMRLKNQMEGHHSRLKGSHHLGDPGAGRSRLRNRETVQALFALAELSMTSLLLADQRQQADEGIRPIRARSVMLVPETFAEIVELAHEHPDPPTPHTDDVLGPPAGDEAQDNSEAGADPPRAEGAPPEDEAAPVAEPEGSRPEQIGVALQRTRSRGLSYGDAFNRVLGPGRDARGRVRVR